jgi:hypothetical protein
MFNIGGILLLYFQAMAGFQRQPGAVNRIMAGVLAIVQ